jgi:2-keto-3-deoxy-L-rhamnonate aldolase RhmA
MLDPCRVHSPQGDFRRGAFACRAVDNATGHAIDDRAVTDAIDHVTKTCQAAGVPLGYFGVSAQAIRPYMERGYTLIAAGVDTLLLAGAARRLLEELR